MISRLVFQCTLLLALVLLSAGCVMSLRFMVGNTTSEPVLVSLENDVYHNRMYMVVNPGEIREEVVANRAIRRLPRVGSHNNWVADSNTWVRAQGIESGLEFEGLLEDIRTEAREEGVHGRGSTVVIGGVIRQIV